MAPVGGCRYIVSKKPREAVLKVPLRDLDDLRSRTVLEQARDAIVSIRMDGTITHFNRAAEVMFGYSADEAIGRDVGLLMPSPYREEHDTYVQRYRDTGEPHAIGRIREVEAVRKSGELFPIELSVSEVRDRDNTIYTAIMRDVSAFRSMVQALRLERDFSNRLIDAAPVIVLVVGTGGSLLRVNSYAQELCGYSLDDLREKDVIEVLFHEADRGDVRRVFENAIAGEQVRGYVNRLVTPAGEVRTIRWSGELLRGPDGKTAALLAVGEDITERMRADQEMRSLEQRARERERLADIGAIAAKLVHDLGNPLSGLSMQAQLLQRRAQSVPGAGISQPAERIVAAAARLNELIRSFMDFAREQRLELHDVDLRAMLSDLVTLWKPVARSGGIDLSLRVDNGDGRVRADDSKLRRVFDNLIRNAIEASEGDGGVRLAVETAASGRVRVRVDDDGPGVAPGVDVFRLFETTKTNGTGIGLAVAKQIVVAHGGSITFVNREPCGASFTVELPVRGPDT